MLRLEEKGTVYTEMVRSFESPSRLVFRRLGGLLYGAEHPLALCSAGFPSAIRELTPAHLRAFHRDNYHLGNMGMIAAFPPSRSLEEVVDRCGAILDDLAADTRPGTSEEDLPAVCFRILFFAEG